MFVILVLRRRRQENGCKVKGSDVSTSKGACPQPGERSLISGTHLAKGALISTGYPITSTQATPIDKLFKNILKARY